MHRCHTDILRMLAAAMLTLLAAMAMSSARPALAGPYDIKIARSTQAVGKKYVEIRFRNTSSTRHSKPCTVLIIDSESADTVKSLRVPALKPTQNDGTKRAWSKTYKFYPPHTARYVLKIKQSGRTLSSRKFRGPEDL